MRRASVAIALSVLLSGLAAAREAVSYMSAEVVAANPQSRTLTIKDPQGTERVMKVDSHVKLSDLKSGDKVILTLRGDTARGQVTSVRVTGANPSPSAVPSPSPSASPSVSPSSSPSPRPEGKTMTDIEVRAIRERAAMEFNEKVATLSIKANEVDHAWVKYKAACRVVLARPYETGRERFGLWDGTAKKERASSNCEILLNDVVRLGEALNVEMAGADTGGEKVGFCPTR